MSKDLVLNLKKKQQTLALAESCTGGLISALITEIPGASEIFHFAGITYSNAVKTRLLNVPKSILDQYGAVSSECVHSMIEGLKKLIYADFYFAVSGIAGPKGGSQEKPVGTVYFACEHKNRLKIIQKSFQKTNSRHQIRMQAVEYAFLMIKDHMSLKDSNH